MENIDKQSELLSRLTKAASVITKMGNRGSADYMITSAYFHKYYMNLCRNSNRRSKIKKIYGNLE